MQKCDEKPLRFYANEWVAGMGEPPGGFFSYNCRMRKVLWISVLMAFSCLPEPPKPEEPDEAVDCDINTTGYFLKEMKVNPSVSSFYYDETGRFLVMHFKPGQKEVEEVTRTEFTYGATGLKEVNEIRVTTTGSRIVTAKSLYYFDSSQRLIGTKRLSSVQGALQPLDSIAIRYKIDLTVSQIDFYDGKTKALTEYHIYTYPQGEVVKVEYRKPPIVAGGQPIDFGTSEYTVDDKLRPFPKEFDYYLIANKFPMLTFNVLQHHHYGGTGDDSTVNTTITYNTDGLPIDDGRQYVYACSPQRE